MARPRSAPPREWLAAYLKSAGLDVDPGQAVQLLDAQQWGRLQTAWRAHQHRRRRAQVPVLKPNTWSRLEVLRRRYGAVDLDDLVWKLYRQ